MHPTQSYTILVDVPAVIVACKAIDYGSSEVNGGTVGGLCTTPLRQ